MEQLQPSQQHRYKQLTYSSHISPPSECFQWHIEKKTSPPKSVCVLIIVGQKIFPFVIKVMQNRRVHLRQNAEWDTGANHIARHDWY